MDQGPSVKNCPWLRRPHYNGLKNVIASICKWRNNMLSVSAGIDKIKMTPSSDDEQTPRAILAALSRNCAFSARRKISMSGSACYAGILMNAMPHFLRPVGYVVTLLHITHTLSPSQTHHTHSLLIFSQRSTVQTATIFPCEGWGRGSGPWLSSSAGHASLSPEPTRHLQLPLTLHYS